MPIFVASPTQVFTGDEAAQRLQDTNDLRFASEDGVVTVDEARWKQAQQAERQVWIELNREATDDHDAAKIAGFNGYADLPHDLGRVLELGCGAFTTVRSILAAEHTAQHITLVDPLADDYRAAHPHCTYREDHLAGISINVFSRTAEDLALPSEAEFDTVILVNVIGHCHDAIRVLNCVRRALKPGGLLIFQEEASAYTPDEIYDVIHPIKVTQAFLDAFITQFEEVYRNGAYFIGRKAVGEYQEMEIPQAMADALLHGVEVGYSRSLPPAFANDSLPETYTVTGIEEDMPPHQEPPAQAPAPKKVKRTATRKPSKK